MSPTAIGRTLIAMIERLTDMPPDTIGFRVSGEIERADYDQVLVPELQRALEAGRGLRPSSPTSSGWRARQSSSRG
jgi:hypothetical protein